MKNIFGLYYKLVYILKKSMNEKLNPDQSLRIIEEMIQNSKMNYKKNHGIYFLFWGYLSIVIVTLFLILKNTVGFPAAHYVWPLFFLGFIFNIYQARKQGKEKLVSTKLDRIIRNVWLGVSIGMAVFYGASPILGWKMLPITLVVTSIATYTHGVIISFKPFIIGAFVMMLLASISFYMTNIDVILGLFVVAILIGYIIPGHMLRSEHV